MARILVVDDNDPLRWTLASLLRARGHKVDQAADGMQALTRFGTGPFDMVLLDVCMPCMDGFEACRELRQRSQVPILMISTNCDPFIRKEAFACGATDFTPKPLNVERLFSWISGILSNGCGLQHAVPLSA